VGVGGRKYSPSPTLKIYMMIKMYQFDLIIPSYIVEIKELLFNTCVVDFEKCATKAKYIENENKILSK
jgi:hypothetical protein